QVTVAIIGLFVGRAVLDFAFPENRAPLGTRNAELAEQLHAVASHMGEDIPIDRMFVTQDPMGIGHQLALVSVDGTGGQKRLELSEASLSQLSPSEISFLVAHELVPPTPSQWTMLSALGAVFGVIELWLTARLSLWAIGRRGPRWGIGGIHELGVL